MSLILAFLCGVIVGTVLLFGLIALFTIGHLDLDDE